MGTDPIRRFRFDFGELVPPSPPVRLRVLGPPGLAVPDSAAAVVPARRPRWLPPLAPVFAAGDPLHVRVAQADAPALGSRLVRGMADLLASAGAESGLRVVRWEDRLAAGAHGLEAVAEVPHALLVPALAWPESVAAGVGVAGQSVSGVTWLVVEGAGRGFDRHLGLDRLPPGVRLLRVPAPGRAQFRAEAAGTSAALAGRGWGRAMLRVAVAVVRGYRESEP